MTLGVLRFLERHRPFSGLDEADLVRLAEQVQIEFHPSGTSVLVAGGEPARFLFVVWKGKVELRSEGVAFDEIEDGEIFGIRSVFSNEPPLADAVAVEDTLCILLDPELARDVLGTETGARFLTMALAARPSPPAHRRLPLETVGAICSSEVLQVPADRRLVDVAADMTVAGVTASLTRVEGRLGIVTDRDLRVSMGRRVDVMAPVSQIATVPVHTISPSDLAADSVFRFLELGIHHLPVVDGGTVVGMLTDLDLLRLEYSDVFRLRSHSEHLGIGSALEAHGSRIRAALVSLVRTGVDAAHVALAAASLMDAAVSALILDAVETEGDPGVPWAWLALGSAGRREQSLGGDQDHAIVYADGGDDQLFGRIAERVVDGLERLGYPRCRSRVMASEVGWRGSEEWWRQRAEDWPTVVDRRAAFLSAIAFDARRVHGRLDLEPILRHAVEAARAAPGFLGRLSVFVRETRVPVGPFGHLAFDRTSRNGGVDVKRAGLLPIIEMARVWSLEAGSIAVSTVERIGEAERAGIISADEAGALVEAFRVFQDLRLTRHLAAHDHGRPFVDIVDPDGLGRLDRGRLRDALRIVRDARAGFVAEHGPRVRHR